MCRHKANRLTAVRIANKPDIVPDVPKAFFLQNIYYVICTLLNWRWGRDRINDAEKLEYWLKVTPALLTFFVSRFVTTFMPTPAPSESGRSWGDHLLERLPLDPLAG